MERLLDSERERVRKQLHDGLGQMLTSMPFLLSSLRLKLKQQGFVDCAELDEIGKLINQAIAESRAIAASCEPAPRGVVLLK